MYNLPSDVYSPRCSPSNGRTIIQGVAQFGRARNLGFRCRMFKSCHSDALIINNL